VGELECANDESPSKMRSLKLPRPELESILQLRSLSRWKCGPTNITRAHKTQGWLETVELTNEIAAICERLNHHPTLTISYFQILICLTTHDIGDVSIRDIELAIEIEACLNQKMGDASR
jgi:4a-hydroxytetrahydrobiopterin dehydratase